MCVLLTVPKRFLYCFSLFVRRWYHTYHLVLSLFVPRLSPFVASVGKGVLPDCGISLVSSLTFLTVNLLINEPAHDKTYNKTYATSEDSDQPAHSHSLISLRGSHVPSTASVLSKEG